MTCIMYVAQNIFTKKPGDVSMKDSCLKKPWFNQKQVESHRLRRLYESYGFKPSGYIRRTFVMEREAKGKGVSSLVLKEMAAIAKAKGFQYVTIPVRPSLKSQYPLIPIDHYVNWR